MADVLAEAGVDFFLIENMGADNEARVLATEAAKNTGLPVWGGSHASMDAAGETVLLTNHEELAWRGGPLWRWKFVISTTASLSADAIKEIAPLAPDLIAVFHSRLADTTAALDVLREEWSGLSGAYPDAGRIDYTNFLAEPQRLQ